MRKGKVITFEVKVEVWGKRNRTLQPYPWQEVFAKKFESDKRFHPIAKAITKMEFFVPVEILLGSYSSSPLFIEMRKVGDMNFFKKQINPLGLSLFDGDILSLQKATVKKIQKEFKTKLFEFLEQRQEQDMREIACYQTKVTSLIDKVIKYKTVLRQLHL